MHRPGKIEVANLRDAKLWCRGCAPRHDRDTEIRLHQLHQIAVGGNLVDLNRTLVSSKALIQALRVLAIAPTQEPRLREISQLDAVARGKVVFWIEHNIE